MPKTLRAAAAGSCRTSAVTPLPSRLSQWASAAGLVPTGLCRWPRLGWSLLGSRLCACFEFGLGGGEFGGHLLSGHGDLALVPVDGGCLALRAGAGVRTGGPRLPPRLTLPARSQPRRDLRRRPVKATHRGGIQRPMRTDLAFGSPPAEQSTLRVVPSEPGHRSRRGVYLARSG